MKYLISIIKFFNKRELYALYAECRSRQSINGMAATTSNGADDANYLKGKAAAYREMGDFIEKEMKEGR